MTDLSADIASEDNTVMQDPKLEYWWQRMKDGQLVWHQLQEACREGGIEVMYTVMESLTQDGRDRSLDYKISGLTSRLQITQKYLKCALQRLIRISYSFCMKGAF